MKKRVGIMIAGACLAMSITGCGGNNVKLGEYKGIEGEKVVCEVSDEEVTEAVEEMMYDYVTYDTVTDRAAIEGDYVNVDYVITKLDGKPYDPDEYDSEEENEEADDSKEENDEEAEEETAEEEEADDVGGDDPYSGYGEDIVIGEEYIYPEVEQALIGMKTGDKKTVSAKLTDDYVDEDMVGKTAEIEVTLNEISVENKPDYNDAFVKENLEYDTVAEYEAALKEQLLSDKEEEYKYETVSGIMQKIIDNSTFNGYDKKTYADCEEEYNSSNEQMAAMYGMELADYEELVGLDEETKKEDILSMVHERQVVEAIAKAENISVSDKDVNEFAEDNYKDYEYDSAEDFVKDYGMDYLKYYLLSEKVYDYIFDNSKLTEITEEEYNKKLEAEDGYDEETDDGEDIGVDLEDADEGSDVEE